MSKPVAWRVLQTTTDSFVVNVLFEGEKHWEVVDDHGRSCSSRFLNRPEHYDTKEEAIAAIERFERGNVVVFERRVG